MCDKNILDVISAKVYKAAYQVLGSKLDRVILYGAYARGDYDEESFTRINCRKL